jgi:hypothetical protein
VTSTATANLWSERKNLEEALYREENCECHVEEVENFTVLFVGAGFIVIRVVLYMKQQKSKKQNVSNVNQKHFYGKYSQTVQKFQKILTTCGTLMQFI